MVTKEDVLITRESKEESRVFKKNDLNASRNENMFFYFDADQYPGMNRPEHVKVEPLPTVY